MSIEADRAVAGEKRCTACGRWFPKTLDYFYRTTHRRVSDGQYGLGAKCKWCGNSRANAWHKKHGQSKRAEADERARRLGPPRGFLAS